MASRKKKEAETIGSLISTNKALRILTSMKVDTEAFIGAYMSDTSRGPRSANLSDEQRKAIKSFLSKGYSSSGFKTLKEALEVKGDAGVHRLLAAYEEEQG